MGPSAAGRFGSWHPPEETWSEALQGGRFADAVHLAMGAEDPVERARALAEIHYRARDPQAALRYARSGLGLAPDDLLLAHRAAAASLWTRSASDAEDACRVLGELVETTTALSEDERAGWREAAEAFRVQAEELTMREAERHEATRRARLAVALLALGCLAGLGWAVRPTSAGRS